VGKHLLPIYQVARENPLALAAAAVFFLLLAAAGENSGLRTKGEVKVLQRDCSGLSNT